MVGHGWLRLWLELVMVRRLWLVMVKRVCLVIVMVRVVYGD